MAKLEFEVPDDVAKSFKILAAAWNVSEDEFFVFVLELACRFSKSLYDETVKVILRELSKSRPSA